MLHQPGIWLDAGKPLGKPQSHDTLPTLDSCLPGKKQVDCAGSGHVGHRERAVAVTTAATETEGSDRAAVPTAKRYGVCTFGKVLLVGPYTLRWARPPPLARAWLVIPGTLGGLSAFDLASGRAGTSVGPAHHRQTLYSAPPLPV